MKPLAEKLVGEVDDAKFDGKTPSHRIGECVVDDAEVVCETLMPKGSGRLCC